MTDNNQPSNPQGGGGSGLAKTTLAFALGIAIGFAMGNGSGAAPVAFSGAMSGLEERAFLGPADAPVTIVEYTDYQCTFCQRHYQSSFQLLLDEYEGRVRYFVRHFPSPTIHPDAPRAAVAAVCAEEQGSFWAYHDILFGAPNMNLSQAGLLRYAEELSLDMDRFNACVMDEDTWTLVQEDHELGSTYGVSGTPAFFINGRVVFGAQPLEVFRSAIDAALEEAGERVN
jgi:protein-disulfide isomerase